MPLCMLSQLTQNARHAKPSAKEKQEKTKEKREKTTRPSPQHLPRLPIPRQPLRALLQLRTPPKHPLPPPLTTTILIILRRNPQNPRPKMLIHHRLLETRQPQGQRSLHHHRSINTQPLRRARRGRGRANGNLQRHRQCNCAGGAAAG